MDPAYADRYLNVGFSGGEKKKAEILQLLMLKPVSWPCWTRPTPAWTSTPSRPWPRASRLTTTSTNALIIITHNAKILEGLQVDYVHVLDDARIVRTGDGEPGERDHRGGLRAP